MISASASPAQHMPLTQIKSARILIVDDIETNCMLVRHMLRKAGYKNIQYVLDALQALKFLEVTAPDLIIVDICMPTTDGISLCRRIKAEPAWQCIPVIALTALNDEISKTTMFEAGASDFLTKPVQAGDLSCRMKVHLENKFLLENLRNYRTRISHELDIARTMQERILPTAVELMSLETTYGLLLDFLHRPCMELGGDCWGFYPLDDRRLGIFIYDFSGHGVGAALNVFRMHALIGEMTEMAHEPGQFLSALNRVLYSLLSPSEFATMFYGIIDTHTHLLEYACAATPDPLLADVDGKSLFLSGAGRPLGVDAFTRYETQQHSFRPGQSLLLYSDALIETRDKEGELFSEKAVEATMRQALQHDPQARNVTQRVRQLFDAHFPIAEMDDLTLAVITRPAK